MNIQKLLSPKPLPFSYESWKGQPHAEKLKMLCTAWATQGYGAPVSVYVFYLLKIGLYIVGWLYFCTFSSQLGEMSALANWWYQPEALYRFILWSVLFEVLGFGCGSGPLTARYFPPMGGFLHFLRPGTIKLPLFPKVPLIGSDKRNIVDVAIYVFLLGNLVRTLIAPVLQIEMFMPIIISLLVLGVLDKTIYLAARSEHYLVALFCLLFPGEEIAALKIVWLAIWWGAATSKLNRHFPAVVCVMISNHGLLQWPWLRKKLYKNYPEDLRPGVLAKILGHAGTATEYLFPLILLLGDGGVITLVGITIMLGFHFYITSSIPMGVPLEWNVIMVFGGLFLFGYNASIWAFSITSPLLIGVLFLSLFVIPLIGNFVPKWISFLLSMRYYAGNWAYSIYFFRGNNEEKLNEHVVSGAETVGHQLSRFYDEETVELLAAKVQAFRVMHLHGRALQSLIPKALDDIENYVWRDGELIAGFALGWNFGEGHLHTEQLLTSIQKRCGFESGELRCIFVESQPMAIPRMDWRIVDAHDGELERGQVFVDDLLELQPYPEVADRVGEL